MQQVMREQMEPLKVEAGERREVESTSVEGGSYLVEEGEEVHFAPAPTVADLSPELQEIVRKHPGRPPVIVDYARVEYYAKHLCTQAQIAAALGISDDQLVRAIKRDHHKSWTEYIAPLQEETLANLQVKMTQKALQGDNVMLRTIAMRHMDYREKTTVEVSGKDGGPVPMAVLVATMSDEEIERRLGRIAELTSTPVKQLSSDVTNSHEAK